MVSAITQPKIAFQYGYDERGNITSETRNGLTTTYSYDALGQLIRVNDPHENKTWVYEYDLGGNIKSKKRYAYTTAATPATLESTINYTYGDSNWKDKLTAYNGQTITYDAIGNPLTDGTWTYTWEAGRQLKKMVSADKTIEFKYNAAGLRTQKKVTEGSTVTTTDYTLHGKLITHMTVGTSNLHFFYDNASRPAMVKYNGVLYTYVHNLQGDIVGIVDASGNLVVEYKYDAWGRPLTKHTGLGKLNPFRYRGYVWDEETELYYLRSRYYNPDRERFINSDSILGIGTSLLSHDAFTYSYNMPVCKSDPTGNSSYLQMVKNNAYAISSADANLPFGDVLVLGLLAGAAILDSLSNLVNLTSSSRVSTHVKDKTRDDDNRTTYIYRSATGTAKSLTPRKKDTNGLSFSTVQPTGKYFRTSIETVNSSGILIALVDPKNPTHILINPIDLSTLQGWIDSRETADTNPHPYTILLMSMKE